MDDCQVIRVTIDDYDYIRYVAMSLVNVLRRMGKVDTMEMERWDE